jgi:hypothetical protein
MKPETRTKNLFALLGWRGGTVHDACREIGVDSYEFLYTDADFGEHGPCADFCRGYEQADDIAIYLSSNMGNLQYWLGAISYITNVEDST